MERYQSWYYFKSPFFKLIYCFHFLNRNGWFSPSRKCYYTLFMFISVYMDCKECLRFIARSSYHIITSLCVDKNGLFIFFQAEKRQQMRQAGQRLIFKWTAFFGGESGFRGQQHHSLGITTGLVCRNNLLLIATLLHLRDLVLRHSVYDQPGRSLRELSICQNWLARAFPLQWEFHS